MTAIGYRRISTQEQAGAGLGLDAQAAAIAATAARLGLTVAATYTDAGVSGGKPIEQRPALLDALAALRRGDVLVVARRDRLGRDVLNVAIIERLVQRKGARVVSAAGEGTDDDGPSARLMRSMVDAFAEYERALIRSRTRAALAVKKARGERYGCVPFGYQLSADGRTLRPHAAEQRALTALRHLRAAGLGPSAIAARLNARGFRTRAGSAWSKQRVYRLTGPREDAAAAAAA